MLINNNLLSKKDKEIQINQINLNKEYIKNTVTEKLYKEQLLKKIRRLSYPAMMSSLFILLYRDHPIFHTPYQIISSIISSHSSLTSSADCLDSCEPYTLMTLMAGLN